MPTECLCPLFGQFCLFSVIMVAPKLFRSGELQIRFQTHLTWCHHFMTREAAKFACDHPGSPTSWVSEYRSWHVKGTNSAQLIFHEQVSEALWASGHRDGPSLSLHHFCSNQHPSSCLFSKHNQCQVNMSPEFLSLSWEGNYSAWV